MTLKTRYKEHRSCEGVVMYYTAEYKFLFKWLPYHTPTYGGTVIERFYSINKVKECIDTAHKSYNDRVHRKIHSTTITTYP